MPRSPGPPMRFVNPRNDIAFKKIFGDEHHTEVLAGFLNALLDLRGDREIAELRILNPFQAPKLEMLKYTLLDVQARDKGGRKFIVEMQLEHFGGIRERFQYYVAKSYSSQMHVGDAYHKLQPVIFVGVLNFTEFSSEHFLSRHVVMNCETQVQELHDFEFYFIELPKFDRPEHTLRTRLEQWVFFLKHADDLEVIPPHVHDIALRTAYETANGFGWTEEELEWYESRRMRLMDERGILESALEKRHAQGLEEGHKQGLAQGLLQGQQQGAREQALLTARTMRDNGLTRAMIAQCTGLAEADLDALFP